MTPEARAFSDRCIVNALRGGLCAKDDQPKADSLVSVGMRIDHYEIVREIGSGGFGVVYEARQLKPVERRVALKVLKPSRCDSLVVERFKVEQQTLASMSHPGVAAVFDAGSTVNGFPYVVMELVEGAPITQYCDQIQATLDERLGLMIQVCRAIVHAHQRRIVHCDLKPSNILVRDLQGVAECKVIDFGIAQVLQPHASAPIGGSSEITPEYASPEQITVSGPLDTRSDVFSLGVVLYELMSGQLPVPGQRLSDHWSHLSKEDSEQLAVLRQQSSKAMTKRFVQDLDWIVSKATAVAKDDRYESVDRLIDDIEASLDRRMIAARPATFRYRLQNNWRRHGLAWSALGIVVSALLFGAITSLMAATKARNAEQDVRRSHARTLTESRAKEAALAKLEVSAEQSRRAAYHAALQGAFLRLQRGDPWTTPHLLWDLPQELRGWEWGYLMSMCQLPDWGIDVSSSGSLRAVIANQQVDRVFTGDVNGGLTSWDPQTGDQTWKQHLGGAVTHLALGIQDRYLAAVSKTETIMIFQAADGALVRKIPTNGTTQCVWSLDGKLLHVATLSDASEMRLINYDTDDWSEVCSTSIAVDKAFSMPSNNLAITPSGRYLSLQTSALAGAVFEADSLTRKRTLGRPASEIILRGCRYDEVTDMSITAEVNEIRWIGSDEAYDIVHPYAPFTFLKFLPDNKGLLAGSRDYLVFIRPDNQAQGYRIASDRSELVWPTDSGVILYRKGQLFHWSLEHSNAYERENLDQVPLEPQAHGVDVELSRDGEVFLFRDWEKRGIFLGHSRKKNQSGRLAHRFEHLVSASPLGDLPTFLPGSETILCRNEDRLLLQSFDGTSEARQLPGTPLGVAFADHEHAFITLNEGGAVYWNRTEDTLEEIEVPLSGVLGVRVSSDGETAVFFNETEHTVWKAQSRQFIYQGQHRGTLDLHPDGQVLALVHEDFLKTIQVPSGDLICQLDSNKEPAHSPRFDPSGDRLFLLNDHEVIVADWRTGHIYLRLAEGATVKDIDFSQDGLTLATAQFSPSLKVHRVRPYDVPGNAVRYLQALTPKP